MEGILQIMEFFGRLIEPISRDLTVQQTARLLVEFVNHKLDPIGFIC